MPDFKRESETELERLPDQGLLAYIEAAREASESVAAHNAASVLAFRYWDRVLARVRLKTPRRDSEDVAMNVMESAIRSAFDGRFLGEFTNWVNTITARRIADYHDGAERRPKTTLLPDEHEGDESVWVTVSSIDEQLVLLPYRELAEEIRCARKQEIHRHVIQLYGPVELGYNGFDAAATKAEIERLHSGESVSEANIHQIWRRFKADLAEAIEADDNSGGKR